MQVRSLGEKDPLAEGLATHSSILLFVCFYTLVFLPGKSDGQRSLEGYTPWGHNKSDTTKGLSTHASINISGKERERLFFFLFFFC